MDSTMLFINNSASLDELKSIMKSVSMKINKLANINSKKDAEQFVVHVENFVANNSSYYNNILGEVEKLDLSHEGKNIETVWINACNDPYSYAGSTKKPVLKLSDYPQISQLMNLVNDNELTTGDANSCLVTAYPTGSAQLGWHADDEEEQISQTSSISSFSLGAEREIEFRKKVSHSTRSSNVLLNHKLSSGSIVVMHPGCQQNLQHRIPEAVVSTGIRYSISFRKFQSEPSHSQGFQNNVDPLTTPVLTASAEPNVAQVETTEENKPTVKPFKPTAHIFAGDSFYTKFDTRKLAKGRQVSIFNIAKGGAKISDTKVAIEEFYNSQGSEFNVKKIFISVGCNDIRHAKNGVGHLRAPLHDLLKAVKTMSPSAKIWCQSLLPLPLHQRPYIGIDVMNMNKIIYHACSKFRIFFIHAMDPFLTKDYRGQIIRNEQLFVNSTNVHPNGKGIGVLARHYIRLIHSKSFNPLGY